MNVLVVGSGGREHAIIKSLKKNSRISKIYAAPGNGGISCDANCINIKATAINAITDFVIECYIQYIVVAPDDPLALGLVDALEKKGKRCFGPSKAAARIESSKVFSKGIMRKYGIPTAAFETFTEPDKAVSYVKSAMVSFPLVIKADGLALGKGVIIAANQADAITAIQSIMIEKKFGDSGSAIVIEEYLEGHEVSILSFTDGKTIVPMISSMDHKRVFDGNKGLNTGGMGAITPNPHYTPEIAEICNRTIFLPTMWALQKEGCPFKGCLYFGLMLTKDGPKVIEYNCRFGDPEAQAILPLLETDLFEIMEAVTDEKLDTIDIRWKNASSACVILASAGYPESYETGIAINGLNEQGGSPLISAPETMLTVYHSGTENRNGSFFTAGGRVLGISAAGLSLNMALNTVYNAAAGINFDGIHYRKDIGKY